MNPLRHLRTWTVLAGALAALTPGRAEVDYAHDVRPLLQARCYACHGALQQKGGLRVDTVAALRQGGKSGPAVRPVTEGPSRLVERVSAADVADRMPPEHEGEPLSPAQVDLLRHWIAAGARGPESERPEADPREHWSFRPRTRPVVPSGDPAEASRWARNPVDRFIAQGHREHGVRPVAEAGPEVLLRRLYLDLVGVPPSAAEVDAFLADPSDAAYARVVDRLLEDPRHGERWARHWMDVWRYSDWWGLGDQLRNSQKHIWHWRDWIVESLNADLPYDAMVRRMLSADETHPEDLGQLRATGFLARNYFLFNRHQWMDETVEHVGKAFLGMTFNCAKCHDHKYDPVAQSDYYRLRAFFEPYHVRLDVVPGEADLGRDGIPRAFDAFPDAPTYRLVRGQESSPDTTQALGPGLPALLGGPPLKVQPVSLPASAWQPERRPWVVDAQMAAARREVEAAEAALARARAGSGDTSLAVAAADVARAAFEAVGRRAEAWRLAWRGNSPEADARMAEARRAELRLATARARHRLVELEGRPAAPDKKAAAEKDLAAARAALDAARQAEAAPLTGPKEPARFVGAAWTPTRFRSSERDDPAPEFTGRSTGRRTALAAWITDPANPLAARVAVNHLWNRHFGTPLVATAFDFGRKGSPPTHPALLDWLASELVDSGWSLKHLHRLLVLSSTYRMGSSVAGAEDRLAADPDNRLWWRRTPVRLEGEVVRDAILALAGTLDPTLGGPSVPPADQAASRRRSLYFFHSNNDRNLFLTTFDAAGVKECYRREQSIVPQQALALVNSGLVRDASRRIADRLAALPPAGPSGPEAREAAFVRRAFQLLLGMTAGPAEVAACRQALAEWRRLPSSSGAAVAEAEAEARAHLVWALINHNDFVTLR